MPTIQDLSRAIANYVDRPRPGEIWDIYILGVRIRGVTVHGIHYPEPTVVFRDVYTGEEYDINDPQIKARRRIFPYRFGG